MEATKQISLDILAVGIPPAVEAKQNDTARVIAASLYAGGNVFDVPVGAIAVFRYRKPDGTAGFYDALPDDTPAISIERNVVTILLVEQVLTVPGDVQCEINLYNTAGEKLTTFTFCLRVQASVLTDAEIISSDYFNVLSEKVSQALQAAADAAASAQEAKDAAASINPGTYMQKTVYDPENKQKPYIPADEALSLESYGGSAVGVVSKADVAAACTGNAATAIKLATARKIGSASFDGTADITLAQMGAATAAQGAKADGLVSGSQTAAKANTANSATSALNSSYATAGIKSSSGKLVLLGQSDTWGLYPDTDNDLSLGFGFKRWKQVFAGSGTISTSDARLKKDIAAVDAAAALALLSAVQPVTYKLIDGESGRTHWGMVSQQVEEAMTAAGLTDMDFAGFIRSPKYESYETGETDERGNPVTAQRCVENEYIYGLRYEEFIAPLIAVVQAQKAQIETLAARVNTLEIKDK